MSDLPFELYNEECLHAMSFLPPKSVDMVLCDLPYGTTQNKWDSIIPLGPLWAEYRRICKGAVVLTAAQPFTSAVVMSQPELFKYSWVWRKQQGTGFLNAKKQPLRNHEDVLIFYSDQPTYNPQFLKGGKPYRCKSGEQSKNYGDQVRVLTESDGRRYPLTVVEFPYDRNKVHPTQKPVKLMEYLIRTYSNPGDTVLDNTMGSGTTGVACMNTGRKFIGMEKDVEHGYFQIAEQRIKLAWELNDM